MGWNENFERKASHNSSASRSVVAAASAESDVRTLTDLLSELQGLLEDYSPAWYGEDLHERIDAALHTARSR